MGLIPENKRRVIDRVEKKRIMIYGKPGQGKTYLANSFPDPLLINTDGNWIYVDAPHIEIKEDNTGRVKPWDNFKAVVDELAKYEQPFKTIIVDLLDDVYEYARRTVMEREEWTHEDDGGSYGKPYKIIADEFIPVIERLLGLDYENIILLVHEKTMTLTKRTGAKYDVICPKLTSGIIDKLTGKVGLVARIVKAGTEQTGYTYTLYLESNSDQDCGFSRLTDKTELPATYEAINEIFNINPMERAQTVRTAVCIDTRGTVQKTSLRKLTEREVDGE